MMLRKLDNTIFILDLFKGGRGSGDFGHSGRKGMVGGSGHSFDSLEKAQNHFWEKYRIGVTVNPASAQVNKECLKNLSLMADKYSELQTKYPIKLDDIVVDFNMEQNAGVHYSGKVTRYQAFIGGALDKFPRDTKTVKELKEADPFEERQLRIISMNGEMMSTGGVRFSANRSSSVETFTHEYAHAVVFEAGKRSEDKKGEDIFKEAYNSIENDIGKTPKSPKDIKVGILKQYMSTKYSLTSREEWQAEVFMRKNNGKSLTPIEERLYEATFG